jgi:hypothetical protein
MTKADADIVRRALEEARQIELRLAAKEREERTQDIPMQEWKPARAPRKR